MKARGAVSAALASAGILLAGWQAGAQVAEIRSSVAAAPAGTGTGETGASGSGTAGPSGLSGSGTAGVSGANGAASSPQTSAAAGTYDGAVVPTRFGSVQVQITVQAGTITEVTALHLTDDDRKSIQISNRAAPLLRTEVLAAQSAEVKTISGATVTSSAYLTSLQAAIDAANL